MNRVGSGETEIQAMFPMTADRIVYDALLRQATIKWHDSKISKTVDNIDGLNDNTAVSHELTVTQSHVRISYQAPVSVKLDDSDDTRVLNVNER